MGPSVNPNVDEGIKILNDLDAYFFENAGIICWWQSPLFRDQRAKLEKTFKEGRFSHDLRNFKVYHLR